MTKLYIAIDEALAVVRRHNDSWTVDLCLPGSHPQCVAVDPLRPQRVYCGTFDRGVWRSDDAGSTWEPANEGIMHQQVMATAVSVTERVDGFGVIYVGTEPSALFRSEDGGQSWRELTALRQLPSAPTWSFPPRPETSHVRWISADPLVSGRVFAAIEAGALVRSLDGGQSWEDRRPDGPYDTHTLIMHRLAPDHLYSAAGDGSFASDDGGQTWSRPSAGLAYHYLWSVAAHTNDPTMMILSAASGPQAAHNPRYAESVIYRRSGGSSWQQVREGLPAQRGALTFVLAADEVEPGVFYAANNQGVYRSADAGVSWDAVPVRWPTSTRVGRAHALVVAQD